MRLRPFQQVDDVGFAIAADELVRIKGPPGRRERNGIGLNEFDYGRVVYRFEDNGRLEEISMQAPVLDLGAVAVPFATLAAFVRAQDKNAFERAGFLVSPRFGIAFDARDPSWVTVLARHAIARWRELASS